MARAQIDKFYPHVPANSTKQPYSGLATAALYRVDGNGFIIPEDLGLFLLNPSTWEESKASNWVQNQIPGQSDPVLQWLSSGPRVVSFDAMVTRDTSLFIKERPVQANKNVANVLGDIAAKFFSTALPAPRVNNSTGGPSAGLLDISDKLNFYRALLYPLYDDVNNPTRILASPPLVTLWNGSTFTKNPYGLTIRPSDDLWVVTNVTIRVTKQLPNLAPQEAIVSFQLTQYTIKSFSSERFTDGKIRVGS
jgi:hypothetical protein